MKKKTHRSSRIGKNALNIIDISFYNATFKCLKMDNYKPVNLWTK